MEKSITKLITNKFKALALGGLLGLSSLGVFAQSNDNGSVESFRQLLNNHVNAAKSTARTGSSTALSLQGANGTFQAKVNASYNKAGYETYAGTILNHGKAEFHVHFKNGKAKGLIVLFDEKKAYEFTTNASGNVVTSERNFDKTISVDQFGKAASAPVVEQSGTPGQTADGVTIPLYQSNPGMSTVLYLDFDGEYVANTPWNGGVAIDAAAPNGSADNIRVIWEMMTEDYSPFNINVTTDRSIYDAAAPGRRQMVIFTPTTTAAPGAGGVAYIGGFTWMPDIPCWDFISPYDAANAAEAGSHEAGHTFGLNHDGRNFPDGTHEEYYGGQGVWGPILGVAYGKAVSQFSKGEYQYASNQEDDLSIISSSTNAFGYKTDDYGSTASTAYNVFTSGNSFTLPGLISTTADQDYFKFTSTGGKYTFNVTNKFTSNSNLNISAQVLNSSLQVVDGSNPTGVLSATIQDLTLSAGTYYLVIDGVGEGDPFTNGYSDYASLGQYMLTGSFTTGGDINCDAIPAYGPYPNIYQAGNQVKYDNSVYECTANNIYNVTPSTSSIWWKFIGNCGTNVKPVVTINAPADNYTTYQYPSDNIPVTVYVSFNVPASAIDSVKYYVVETVCNGPGCTNVRRFTLNSAPFTLSFIPSLVGSGFTQVTAVAFSKGQASDGATSTFYIKPLPELSIVSPVDGSSVSRSVTSIPVDVSVDSYNLMIDSVVYNVSDVVTTGMGGYTTTRKFVVTNPYDFSLPVVANQTYTRISAVAYGDGGKFSRTQTVQVVYNEVPTVVITAPTSTTKYNAGGSITVKADASDVDGFVIKVEIYSPQIDNSVVTLTQAPYQATFNNLPSSGRRGVTTFLVKATDNKGGVYIASIDVPENRTPAITVTSPLPTNGILPKYIPGTSMTVSANITDIDGSVAQVVIALPKTGQSFTLTGAPYSATFTNLPAPYPDGSLNYTITATDNDGGVSSSLIVLYRNRIPSASISTPTNNATYTAGNTITIGALVYDPDWTSGKVEYFAGSTKLGEQAVSGVLSPSAINFNWTNVAAGTYSLTVKATDDMGESNTSSAITVVVNGQTTCSAAAWNATTAYSTGAIVQYNGIKYKANWWTQGDQPDTHSGPSGSGQPWTSQGTCTSKMSAVAASESTNKVYPNPFADVLNVTANSYSETVKVIVSDLSGLMILEQSVAVSNGSANVALATSQLESGIYVVQVISGEEVTTYKVVK
jgi:chitodextrinase